MFEGLNAIPWAKLTHAYGSAKEVPMWLRQLASDDTKVRKEAMSDLWGSICHQNWICPATGYAVPYLIELLRKPSVQGKDEILGLLADIASCEPLDEPTWRHNPRVRAWEVPARIPFKDARAEVAAGIPVYGALLEHEQVPVRMQAALVLSAFPERAVELWPILEAAYKRESDERVRANLVLALGELSQHTPEHLPFFEDLVSSNESELMRFVAALALARLAKEQTPQDVADLLASVMQQGRVASSTYGAYEDLACGGGYPWSAALWALYELGPARLRFFVPLLKELLRSPWPSDWLHHDALTLTEMLLHVVFDAQHYNQTYQDRDIRPLESLTPEQREALDLICASPDSWEISGNIALDMRRYGLPETQDQMAAYLGLELPESRLSRITQARRRMQTTTGFWRRLVRRLTQ